MPRTSRRSLAFTVAVALAMVTGVAQAQLLTEIVAGAGTQSGSVSHIEVHQAWTLRCDGDATKLCRIFTNGAGRSDAGAPIAVDLAGEPAAKGNPLFYFRAPLDLLVANGAELRLKGGKAVRLAYRSCHAAGCLIPFRLTDELAARFRKDAAVTLRVFDLDGKPADILLSLAGFGAALKAMQNRT